jgi:hypothetical protein
LLPGEYANWDRPDVVMAAPNMLTAAPSPLVRRSVTTSFGFATIHVLIVVRYETKVPASFSVQVVWHSSRTPLFRCVWAWRNRIPPFSCDVTDSSWLSVGKMPTNAESWAPINVTFEYLRLQSAALPLHVCAVTEPTRRRNDATIGKSMVFDLPMGRALERRDEKRGTTRLQSVSVSVSLGERERERERKERDLGAASP